MSNPIGYSDKWPAGIDRASATNLSTTPATAVDPGIEVDSDGVVYYYRPPPVEILVDGGPDCSPTPLDAVGISGHHYPYTQYRTTGAFDQSQSSDIPATDAAGAAAGTLVTVSWDIAVDVAPGYVHCDPAHTDPITMTVDPLTMDGSIVPFTLESVELQVLPRSSDSLPTYEVSSSSTSGFSGTFYLLRPTALHWLGQDPDNIGNRIFWNPSEIGRMGYRIFGLGRHLSVSVDWQVKSYRRTTFPPICQPPVTTVIPGPQESGLWPTRGAVFGNEATKPDAVGRAQFDLKALVYLARSIGFPDPPMAASIAMAESGGNSSATNFNPGPPSSTDRGLWQINDLYHAEVSDACAFDPACCARAALRISDNGTDWSPWSTFGNGAYLQFLADARAVV